MKYIYIIVILIVIITLGYFGFKNKKEKIVPITQDNQEEIIGWQRGNLESKVKLVEWSDFQCPACYYYFSILKELDNRFGDQILFEYRNFPLKQIHRNAMMAAISTEAAGVQNKFWEMYDKLFENQKDWSNMNKTKFEQTLAGYAEEIGLDVEKFKSDLVSKEIADKVEASYKFAIKNKIDSTPTFFLNDNKINNPRTIDEFSKIIQDKLDEN